jgi:hypothetical protein
MPRAPGHRPPAPDERQAALPLPAARRKPPTPEQIAKVVTVLPNLEKRRILNKIGRAILNPRTAGIIQERGRAARA